MAIGIKKTFDEKIGSMLRRLNDGDDGDIVITVHLLRQVLKTASSDMHKIAERIEKPAVSEEDLTKKLEEALDKGIQIGLAKCLEQGRRSAVIATAPSMGMLDVSDVGTGVNGYSWLEIAEHCERNMQNLNSWEQGFIPDMARKLRYTSPSPKEAAKLHQIFHQRFGEKI